MPFTFEYQPPKASVLPKFHKGAEIGITAVGEALLNAALELVPRESNRLAESGHTTPEGPLGVAVSFGMDDGETHYHSTSGEYEVHHTVAATADYAVIQHEGDFNHPNGGQANYLGEPMHSDTWQLLEVLADSIKAVMFS